MKALFAVVSALLVASPGLAQAAKEAAPAPARTRAKPKSISREPTRAPGPLRPVNITSKLFEITPNTQQAVWTGDVIVERDDVKVTCDRLTAEFDEARRVRKVTCEGNAHMIQRPQEPGRPEREAWGEVAVFDNERSVLTVTGKPRAREGLNTFNGEKVIYLVDEDRVVVEKPVMVIETQQGAEALGKSSGGQKK